MSNIKKGNIKWIGLGKILAKEGSDIFGESNMAYVNILGLAKNKAEFRKKAKLRLNVMDLKLVRIEKAEPLSARISKFQVHKSILKAATKLKPGNNIDFATFHTYVKTK